MCGTTSYYSYNIKLKPNERAQQQAVFVVDSNVTQRGAKGSRVL